MWAGSTQNEHKIINLSVEVNQLFLEAGQCSKTVRRDGNLAVAGRPSIVGAAIKLLGRYEEKRPVAVDETILKIVDDRGDRDLKVMELR